MDAEHGRRARAEREGELIYTSGRITVPEVPCCMFAKPFTVVGGMTTYSCALHGSRLVPHTPEQEVAFVSKVVHSMTP